MSHQTQTPLAQPGEQIVPQVTYTPPAAHKVGQIADVTLGGGFSTTRDDARVKPI